MDFKYRVTDPEGKVIWDSYGHDNLDSNELDKVILPTLKSTDLEMIKRKMCVFQMDDLMRHANSYTQAKLTRILNYTNGMRDIVLTRNEQLFAKWFTGPDKKVEYYYCHKWSKHVILNWSTLEAHMEPALLTTWTAMKYKDHVIEHALIYYHQIFNLFTRIKSNASQSTEYIRSFTINSPFNMDFTLRQCKEQIPVADYSNLNPYECIQFVQSLWRRLVESKLLYDNPILQYMLMERLSPHAVIVKHKFHLKHLVWIAQKLKTTLRKRMIHPGESVGTNSSQNMGEVFTQMALKTPHFSTFQSVVAGSQRLGQLVNGQFKHPQMTLVLTPEVHSQAKAEVIATEFVISFMKDVITEYPTYIVDSENVYVTFTIDTQECIRRVITGREMSLALARRLKIGLDQVQVPFMDEIIHCETFTLMVTVSTDDYPTEREYCNMLANLTYRTVIHGMGGFRGKYNKVAKKDVEPIVLLL